MLSWSVKKLPTLLSWSVTKLPKLLESLTLVVQLPGILLSQMLYLVNLLILKTWERNLLMLNIMFANNLR